MMSEVLDELHEDGSSHPSAFTYDKAYDRFNVPAEFRSPEHFFFDVDQEGNFFPVPREIFINGDPYNLSEEATVISPKASVQKNGVAIGSRSIIMANASIGYGSIIGYNCLIEEDAQISNSSLGVLVKIGIGTRVMMDSVLENQVEIGASSLVCASKIGSHTSIGSNSTIARSQLGDDVKVGSTCTVESADIGDGVELEHHVIVNSEVKIGKDSRVLAESIVPAGKRLKENSIGVPKRQRRVRLPDYGRN